MKSKPYILVLTLLLTAVSIYDFRTVVHYLNFTYGLFGISTIDSHLSLGDYTLMAYLLFTPIGQLFILTSPPKYRWVISFSLTLLVLFLCFLSVLFYINGYTLA
jgi:hypothetical protein